MPSFPRRAEVCRGFLIAVVLATEWRNAFNSRGRSALARMAMVFGFKRRFSRVSGGTGACRFPGARWCRRYAACRNCAARTVALRGYALRPRLFLCRRSAAKNACEFLIQYRSRRASLLDASQRPRRAHAHRRVRRGQERDDVVEARKYSRAEAQRRGGRRGEGKCLRTFPRRAIGDPAFAEKPCDDEEEEGDEEINGNTCI